MINPIKLLLNHVNKLMTDVVCLRNLLDDPFHFTSQFHIFFLHAGGD